MPETLSKAELAQLAKFDTPTICNALEIVSPERRAHGFNRRPLVCPFPEMKPIVGYARTATIRSREPDSRTKTAARQLRVAYYEHIAAAPLPSLAMIQDIDGPDRGFGAFWGEVQTTIHKALGCIGTVTDGSVRDIDMMASGFQVLAGSIMPSHAHVHLVDVACQVSIAGMIVDPGDLIHADRHGAVVIPHAVAKKVPAACDLLTRKEAVILKAARKKGFSVEELKQALAKADEIH
ncbi:MAG: RraA family protein [Proteobacteria bacterium]|nr:RraA family protein [Pseudomonadota bacterium]MBI3500088.1 RraA family protein [Pseudomonadota bacterium]